LLAFVLGSRRFAAARAWPALAEAGRCGCAVVAVAARPAGAAGCGAGVRGAGLGAAWLGSEIPTAR